MKGKRKHANESESSVRATLTSIPEEVVNTIVGCLDNNDKVNLALCCKTMLPILYKGVVSVSLDKPSGGRPLNQLSRCLTKQPDGILHLRLISPEYMRSTRQLIDLSLLSNLRNICMKNVLISLPALQPVAAQLQSLSIDNSRLCGSAAEFLSVGWSALSSLSLDGSWMAEEVLTALNLPALEDLRTAGFEHKGGALQPDQLCCPQLRSLALLLDSSLARGREGSKRCCSLLNLDRLETLIIIQSFNQATMDLNLPASLKHLTVRGSCGSYPVDLKWVLFEAVKNIRGGAHLCSLTCFHTAPFTHPEGTPWGASTVAHYRALGEQLRGLEELSVCGRGMVLLSVVGTLACSAPSLTSLEFCVSEDPDGMDLPPISSASLKTITGRYELTR